jgi:methyl-accepting chemotaxis protein
MSMKKRGLLIVALVVAFQAGRLMPAGSAGIPFPRAASAFAQVADACSNFEDPASPEAMECRILAATIDRIAEASLQRLGARIEERTEQVRPAVLPALEMTVQERLGGEIEQVRGLVAKTEAIMNRTAETLARSRAPLDQTRGLLDDTEDVLDDAENVIDDADNVIDDAEDLLDETEDVLTDTQKLLDRTTALETKIQEDVAEINKLVDQIEQILPRR